jgi:ssDNA-binding Zn-finger/Zn-ribbon topoisomerase 1
MDRLGSVGARDFHQGCGGTLSRPGWFCAEDMLECPYCRLLLGTEAAVACPRCGTPHHLACWEELGGCASEGCPGMIQTREPEAPTSYWGSATKTCPYCAEDIPVAATTCPQCGSQFSGMRPMDAEEVLPQMPDPTLQGCRTAAKWLLIFSLLPPTSPFALVFGALWYRDNRAAIQRSGGDVGALAMISFGICGLYLLVALLVIVIFQFKTA